MQNQLLNAPFFIPSAIFFIASIPLALGIVPRNRWYGIRTSKTMSDNEIWVSANRAGGSLFILSSLIYLGTALLIPYTKSAPDNFSTWGIHLAAFVIPLAASVYMTLRHIRKF